MHILGLLDTPTSGEVMLNGASVVSLNDKQLARIRNKEIGLRKALGATPANIALQFLVESVLVSVLGGLMGLSTGALATKIAQKWIQAEIELATILLAIGFSTLVGIVFGTYPAIKASKLDPIEALRYE